MLFRSNFQEVAKAGLLHDYFIRDPNISLNDKIKSTFTHPKLALKTANNNFNLSDMESDIIRTHMFPINLAVPKYAESWIVNIVVIFIGLDAFCPTFFCKFCYVFILCLINILSLFVQNTNDSKIF